MGKKKEGAAVHTWNVRYAHGCEGDREGDVLSFLLVMTIIDWLIGWWPSGGGLAYANVHHTRRWHQRNWIPGRSARPVGGSSSQSGDKCGAAKLQQSSCFTFCGINARFLVFDNCWQWSTGWAEPGCFKWTSAQIIASYQQSRDRNSWISCIMWPTKETWMPQRPTMRNVVRRGRCIRRGHSSIKPNQTRTATPQPLLPLTNRN